MKKRITIFTVLLFTALFSVKAQGDWGIKGGLSYNTNGEFLSEAEAIIDDKGEGKNGFNIGLYKKYDLGALYLRPELVYTKTKSTYAYKGGDTDYDISRIDVPVLVGFKAFGPINVFAGPAFQYILDNDLDGFDYQDIKSDLTVGVNIGVSVELGKLGIDARYERGLSSNEAEWTNLGNTFTLDSRPEQLIFSLSYSLSKE